MRVAEGRELVARRLDAEERGAARLEILDAEAARAVELRDETEVGEGRRVTHGEATGDVLHALFVGREADLVEVLRVRLAGVRRELVEALHRSEVLVRLDAGVDHLRELADACAQVRIRRQERRLGEDVLEELEDGDRLRDQHAAASGRRELELERGQLLHRVAGVVLGRLLLAVHEVHGHVLVLEVLEPERDAHAPRGRASPVPVELHRWGHASCLRPWSARSSSSSRRARRSA